MVKVVEKYKESNSQPSNGALYGWGAFWSWVIGTLFSKVYILWAVWFQGEGHINAGIDGWVTELPPLWYVAFTHPRRFQIVCTGIFVLIGLLFVRFLIKNQSTKRNLS